MVDFIAPHLISANVRSALGQRATFFLRALLMFANNFIFFTIWLILFQQVDQIGGWRLQDVALIFGLSASSYGLGCALFHGFVKLPELVSSGGLDSYLLKPGNALLQVLTSRSEASAWGDFVSGFVFIYFSGNLSLSSLPLILLCLLCGACAYVSSGVIFHSLCFWFEQVEELAFRLWETTISFSLYPESIYPGAFRFLLYIVWPAAFVSFLPARLVRSPSMGVALLLILGSLAFALLASFVFKRGLLRYESGNRWSLHGS